MFTTVKEYDVVGDDGRPVIGDDGKPEKRSVFIRKGYTMFNLEQVEYVPDEAPFQLDEPLEAALVRALPELHWGVGGNRACYSPMLDAINMPESRKFKDEGAWYSTKLHESVHATGHKSRLNRHPDGWGRFGSVQYAKEELTAEIGSAFLCAHLGIDGFLQHPECIGNWIEVLQDDKREVFRAASRAQKASDFLLEGMELADSAVPEYEASAA